MWLLGGRVNCLILSVLLSRLVIVLLYKCVDISLAGFHLAAGSVNQVHLGATWQTATQLLLFVFDFTSKFPLHRLLFHEYNNMNNPSLCAFERFSRVFSISASTNYPLAWKLLCLYIGKLNSCLAAFSIFLLSTNLTLKRDISWYFQILGAKALLMFEKKAGRMWELWMAVSQIEEALTVESICVRGG